MMWRIFPFFYMAIDVGAYASDEQYAEGADDEARLRLQEKPDAGVNPRIHTFLGDRKALAVAALQPHHPLIRRS